MQKRLTDRSVATGRVDDNQKAIANRISFYKYNTLPILAHIDEQDKLVVVRVFTPQSVFYFNVSMYVRVIMYLELLWLVTVYLYLASVLQVNGDRDADEVFFEMSQVIDQSFFGASGAPPPAQAAPSQPAPSQAGLSSAPSDTPATAAPSSEKVCHHLF